MSDDCLFCKIIAGSIPATVVVDEDDILAFEDIAPQAPVHTLVIPKRHIPTLNDLTDDTLPLVGRVFDVARRVARDKGLVEPGYRIVWNAGAGAGQTVFHIHAHLLGGRDLKWPPG